MKETPTLCNYGSVLDGLVEREMSIFVLFLFLLIYSGDVEQNA